MPPIDTPPSSRPPGSGTDTPARRIPPPRNVLLRTLLLLIEPEAWARAAMYNFRITLGPLVLVSLIMASIIAINGCHKMYGLITQFSQTYDAHYDPMVLTAGHLKVIPTAGKKPLRYTTPLFSLYYGSKPTPPHLSSHMLLSIKLTPDGYFIAGSPFLSPTQLEPYKTWHQIFARTLALPIKGGKLPPVNISSQTLLLITRRVFFYMVIIGGMILALLGTVGMLLWAAIAMVFAAPIVALVNLELRMPLRVAYRIACAVTVPMTVVRAVLLIYNVLPSEPRTFTQEMLPFLVPVGVSIWAAFMARKMYGPARPAPPRR